MQGKESVLSISEYLKLDVRQRIKLYVDKDLSIDWNIESEKIPTLNYPCHFPALAINSRCPFLKHSITCTNLEEWINCEEVSLKKKLELNQAGADFENRKSSLTQESQQPPPSA